MNIHLHSFFLLFCFSILCVPQVFAADVNSRGIPILPTSNSQAKSFGVTGSAGAGFTDFVILNPSQKFRMERGTYVTVQLERAFNFAQLYFTMNLSQMNAEGVANYSFTDLSASTTYAVNNLKFNATLMDLSLGLKLKLIDGYWFRPYVEGGGVASYYQIKYYSSTALDSQGAWKQNEVLMGAGGYGEGGLEVQFSDMFGLKFAARISEQQSAGLVTLSNERIKMRTETYFFSAMIGF